MMRQEIAPDFASSTKIIAIGTIYKHYKGLCYKVLALARHSETLEELVVYQALYGEGDVWVRPLTMFLENITMNGTIMYSWTYGPCGRLESLVEAGQKETRYIYNGQGQLEQIIRPDRTALHHIYDGMGRLGSFYAYDFNYKYTYDKNDRILSVDDTISKIETIRAYDPLGSVIHETLGNGLSLSNTYDTHGRRIQSTLPDGSLVDYSYQTNRLHQISRKGLKHTYAERDLEGNLSIAELPADLGTISIERDPLSRWKKFASPFYSSLFGKEAYDPVGNLCRYQYTDQIGSNECSYSYDDLRQLTSENGHHYLCDSLQNRLRKDDLHYQINDLSQITNDGAADYEYNANGDLIFDGTSYFTYDSLDRLTSVQKGNIRIVFAYDSFNRRLSKTLFTNDKKIKSQLYFYDGDNEIGSTDENGTIEELRILGEGLGAEIGASVFVELNGKMFIPIHDHRGCVVTMIDPKTKESIEIYRYSAFGEELTNGELSPWRFASKRMDPETGWIFFGRRYYSPTLGRWITPDPQGFEDGPNLYAYLHNCPLVDVDPYGLFSRGQAISTFFGLPGVMMNFFGIGQPKNYATFEHSFSEKSHNFDLNRPELPVGEIGRTNGVCNSDLDVRRSALRLSEMAGGVNTHATYNASHGEYHDMHESVMNMRGINTEPVWQIQKRWDRYFDNDTSGAPYYEECHSQGTALVKNALTEYPKERRDNMMIRAFAPSSYIPKELCGNVRHYVSDHDKVHLFDFRGRKQCADTTVLLKRHPTASKWLDHSIDSPTFTQARKEAIIEYLEKLKSYQK